jgi:hypothetical protein
MLWPRAAGFFGKILASQRVSEPLALIAPVSARASSFTPVQLGGKVLVYQRVSEPLALIAPVPARASLVRASLSKASDAPTPTTLPPDHSRLCRAVPLARPMPAQGWT